MHVTVKEETQARMKVFHFFFCVSTCLISVFRVRSCREALMDVGLCSGEGYLGGRGP